MLDYKHAYDLRLVNIVEQRLPVFRFRVEGLVVGVLRGLTDPVGASLGRAGGPDIVQALEKASGDFVSARFRHALRWGRSRGVSRSSPWLDSVPEMQPGYCSAPPWRLSSLLSLDGVLPASSGVRSMLPRASSSVGTPWGTL